MGRRKPLPVSQNYFRSRDNYFRFDGNRKYCHLNSQVNNSKASGRQKSTSDSPGDKPRRISTFRWTGSSIPVVGWHPVALCASLLATTQRNMRLTGGNSHRQPFFAKTGSRNMAETTSANSRYPTSYSTLIQYMDISTTVWPLKYTSGLVGFFKVAAAAIFHFLNSEILRGSRVKMINVRHGDKFSGDRSNRCWDIFTPQKLGSSLKRTKLGSRLTTLPGPRPPPYEMVA